MKKFFLLPILVSLLFVSCDNEKNDNGNPANLSSAKIERDRKTKEATFSIDADGDWKLYGGASTDAIDRTKAVAEGSAKGSYPLTVSTSSRVYFEVASGNSKLLLSEKLLPMSGGYNFRDLGGIKTADGKRVKWGMLMRADAMNKLTTEDVAYLNSMSIKSVVDFRTSEEIDKKDDNGNYTDRDVDLGNGTVRTELNIEAGNIPMDSSIYMISPEDAKELIDEVYIELVTDETTVAQYKKFFAMLQDDTKTPILYHCTSGKDRTGMASALILFALGVDEETIYEDYLMSNTCLAKKNQGTIQYVIGEINKYPLSDEQKAEIAERMTGVLNYLLGVDRDCLKGGIDQIKKDHGSVEKYLTEVLNVDLAKFRGMYLY